MSKHTKEYHAPMTQCSFAFAVLAPLKIHMTTVRVLDEKLA